MPESSSTLHSGTFLPMDVSVITGSIKPEYTWILRKAQREAECFRKNFPFRHS